MKSSKPTVSINEKRDIERAQIVPELESIAHIFDAHWHGIRSASSCIPGHKIAISHKTALTDADVRQIADYLQSAKVKNVFFQGYSPTANALARKLRFHFGPSMGIHVITHVNSAQFENHFELEVLRQMVIAQREGTIDLLGSVKPYFSSVCEAFKDLLLVNVPPVRSALSESGLRDVSASLIPLENSWRKNLYSNVLAAKRAKRIKSIQAVNFPAFLDLLEDLNGIKIIPFMAPAQLIACMASVGLVFNVTLAECQPMTQLEALSVNTPCLTGPLFIPELENHEYSKLTEIKHAENVREIADRADRILAMWETDMDGLKGIMEDFYDVRVKAGVDSYLRFLDS